MTKIAVRNSLFIPFCSILINCKKYNKFSNKAKLIKIFKYIIILILLILSIFTKFSYYFNTNYINIAYAFDNNYYYITHVSMKSVMLNQNKNTFIIFHILVFSNIYNQQKDIIDIICKEHRNCQIKYYIIKNELKEFSVRGRIIRTTAIYYRLLLQNLLKNEKKTFYFDCDTLIYKDLTQVYNLNITDNYYVGAYEGLPLFQYRKKKLNNFINSGVILPNFYHLTDGDIF